MKTKSIDECDDLLEWFTGVSRKQAKLNHKAVLEGYSSHEDKVKKTKSRTTKKLGRKKLNN